MDSQNPMTLPSGPSTDSEWGKSKGSLLVFAADHHLDGNEIVCGLSLVLSVKHEENTKF